MRLDELETVRLADLEKRKHREAARAMGVSRQTFERILKNARAVVADALVYGKIINIEK